ncbi:MAG: arginine--tRNA ligase [Sphaerochaetaceae bacterium]|nr:arginine--tRNA ligase [Sphaerochaetaceae bacterium]MDD5075651.1 arginine--tRNA ligase [Sphaerochaetaceae bacterium]
MLQKIKMRWKATVEQHLHNLAEKTLGKSELIKDIPLVVQVPPKPELGDVAFPLFAYAKPFRTSPQKLVEQLIASLNESGDLPAGTLLAAGPYLNVKIDTAELANELETAIRNRKEQYGHTSSMADKRVMVEFSCPNTNKPLHLGHLRNDAIGQSIAAILKANGADVHKVNLINNRGVHICKSMLAYMKFGNNETPESSSVKGDHLVGNYYVRFAQWEKEDPTALEQAQTMLKQWEDGDPEIVQLWEKMNRWTLDGIKQTYDKTGISFDTYYYESDTYKLGRDKVASGLKANVFYKESDGSVWIDLAEIGLDKKVLLRKDGTSLYLTQDIGTAIARHEDWPFDSLIYVVANEQSYHFKVLFHVLQKLGYDWASDLHHLAYGMVNLPEGKMKSREGTVVDADDLFDMLAKMATSDILEKGREEDVKDVQQTSEAIALGALNYYLLQVNPLKDMIFNPAESLSFNGNTGPYLQYMGARISSMYRKYVESGTPVDTISFDGSLLNLEEERELIKSLADFEETVKQAAANLDPSVITAYLYDVSRKYSKYYHDYPILKAESKSLIKARLTLSLMVLQVLRNAYELIGIPFLETM